MFDLICYNAFRILKTSNLLSNTAFIIHSYHTTHCTITYYRITYLIRVLNIHFTFTLNNCYNSLVIKQNIK